MLGILAAKNLELIQLDVKTAFLHNDLEEEIYMEQLKGGNLLADHFRSLRHQMCVTKNQSD